MTRNYPLVRLRATIVIEYVMAESMGDTMCTKLTPYEQAEDAFRRMCGEESSVVCKTEIVGEDQKTASDKGFYLWVGSTKKWYADREAAVDAYVEACQRVGVPYCKLQDWSTGEIL